MVDFARDIKEIYKTNLNLLNLLPDTEDTKERRLVLKGEIGGIETALKALKMYHLLEDKETKIETNNLLQIGVICRPARKNLCTCGTFLQGYEWDTVNYYGCRVCGNTNWVSSKSAKVTWRKANSTIEVVADYDKKQIKLIRKDKKYSIDWVKEEINQRITESELLIDIEERKVYKVNKKKLIELNEEEANSFAKGVYDMGYESELEETYNKMSPLWKIKKTRYTNFLYSFTYYLKHPHTLLLNTLGKDNFFEPERGWRCVDTTQTSPTKMLGVTNRVIRFMIDRPLEFTFLPDIKEFIADFGVDNFINGIELMGGHWNIVNRLESLRRLLTEGYKIKDLYAYTQRAYQYQALEQENTLQLLCDYVNMSLFMEVGYIKYPKTLRLVHDVRQRDYKVVLDEKQTEIFRKRCEDKHYLNHKQGKYSIVVPKEPTDVTREGQVLGHCVASYVPKIVQGDTTIVFLRQTDDIDTPYVTIELTKRNHIVQMEGKNRRKPSKDDLEFITKWANKKGITYNFK